MFDQQREGDVLVLTPTESLDGRLAAQAREFIDQLLDAGSVRLVFDLSGVEFIDSSGIGVLVSGVRKSQEMGGGVALFGLSENIKMIFEVAMLSDVFEIAADRQTAISKVRG